MEKMKILKTLKSNAENMGAIHDTEEASGVISAAEQADIVGEHSTNPTETADEEPITKKETARILLGRRLNIKFTFPVGNNLLKFDQTGTVVGVRLQTFSDYSIHVKFDKMLNQKTVESVKGLSSSIK